MYFYKSIMLMLTYYVLVVQIGNVKLTLEITPIFFLINSGSCINKKVLLQLRNNTFYIYENFFYYEEKKYCMILYFNSEAREEFALVV